MAGYKTKRRRRQRRAAAASTTCGARASSPDLPPADMLGGGHKRQVGGEARLTQSSLRLANHGLGTFSELQASILTFTYI